jgi:mannose-6-phosphate isomerase-like protein (cupin superfamily)
VARPIGPKSETTGSRRLKSHPAAALILSEGSNNGRPDGVVGNEQCQHRVLRVVNRLGVDKDTAAKVRSLSARGRDAVITIAQQEMEGYLPEAGGAKGISVADVLEPQQISTDLYIGATSPLAATEVPHWHPKQTEVYFVVHGQAQILAKYRADAEWNTTPLVSGDLLIVQPETCHWFRWISKQGLIQSSANPRRWALSKWQDYMRVLRSLRPRLPTP